MFTRALHSTPWLLSAYACRSAARTIASTNQQTSAVRSVADRLHVKRRSRRFFRNYLLLNGVLLGGGSLYYFLYLTTKERRQVRVTFEGIQRALRYVIDVRSRVRVTVSRRRSFRIGFLIAADYKYYLWKTPETSPDYEEGLKECHRRSADRISKGCIENGGLYVKMGQGIVTADHMAPKEYIEGLRCLLDRALRRQRNEVRDRGASAYRIDHHNHV